MKPEDVKEHLQRGHGVHAANTAPTGETTKAEIPSHTDIQHYGPQPGSEAGIAPDPRDEAVFANISASYFMLRRSLAFVAFMLPIVLILGAGVTDIQGSISAYYHFSNEPDATYGDGQMRNVFVGALWAIGTFLVAYKGYSLKENVALNVAGAAAVLVSLFPMDWPDVTRTPSSVIGKVHFASAATLFLMIAYVCIRRSNDTLEIMRDEARKRRFRRTYQVLGVMMMLVPATVFVFYKVLNRENDPSILGLEIAAVWVFAVFWLVKSREIAILERQKPAPRDAGH